MDTIDIEFEYDTRRRASERVARLERRVAILEQRVVALETYIEQDMKGETDGIHQSNQETGQGSDRNRRASGIG